MTAIALPPIAPAETDEDGDAPGAGRFRVTPAVEVGALLAAAAVAAVSYVIVAGSAQPGRVLTPLVVAVLLVANLVPGVLLLMLLGRRIARRRAAASPIGGRGRLHVRLVALFSVMAAIPMLLVTIVASLLFQYGVQFWYSDRASGMLENARELARTSYAQVLDRWDRETVAMAGDLSPVLRAGSVNANDFSQILFQQTYYRNLNEAAIYQVMRDGEVRTLALVNPYERDLSQQLDAGLLGQLRGGRVSVVKDTGERIQTVAVIPDAPGLFLYTGRLNDSRIASEQSRRAAAVYADYQALLARARGLQLLFNAALLILSLVIVGLMVWVALTIADRMVRPVGELVGAARRVADGDLSARVSDPRGNDEVGTLARAFNQMTGRLEGQNAALLSANDQLEHRRALIEAVMAGVSAGVVAVTPDRTIRIANSSAAGLLGAGTLEVGQLVGRSLSAVAPELDALVDSGVREGVTHVGPAGEARTLAVRVARTEAGPILTFDDITEQLADQRRAAWSDVARRIAHEIKNPLTPIQLAAERLQRRYGPKVGDEDATFARLTGTIVRQVGDLRRMVDEFSSFARMPKPSFAPERLADIAREALFLQEVAHPAIRFTLAGDEAPMVCDRRQMGQAFTNIVKNAAEAVEAKGGDAAGEVVMTVAGDGTGPVTVTLADTGAGLPAERERLLEPYVTTRARGTGLGLAIVKKIVEDHLGTIGFSDRDGGGTVVTIVFDAPALAAAAGIANSIANREQA